MSSPSLPRVRRSLMDELLRQLQLALEDIDAVLRKTTSADVARRLARQRGDIMHIMEGFRVAAERSAHAIADTAWLAGIEATMSQVGHLDLLPRISTRQLLAVRTTLTDRIADVTRKTISRIDGALTQHLIGTRTLSRTITDIELIMGGEPRARAMTIAYTEVGRVYSAAQWETMMDQERRVPGLKKKWVHSGKTYARPAHVRCARQPAIPVATPFEIPNPRTGVIERLQFPRDPNASAENSVRCGCLMIAVVPSTKDVFA